METKKTRRSAAAKKPSAKKTTTRTTSKKPAARKAGGKKTSRKSPDKTAAPRGGGGKGGQRRSHGGKIDVSVDGGTVRVSREIGGRTLILETGRMARQADGAVVARYGDTMVLATAQSSKARADIDFFPLTVDYRERYPAAGRFPGGFFKREGRPTNREVLTCRIIDRSIRPLFPDGFKKEVQVLSNVLSTDMEVESDILAAVGSFAAVAISSIPHEEHLGAVRIGMIDDEFVVNPTWSQVQSDDNQLTLTIAGHKDAIVMVEASAEEISEERMLEALDLAKTVCAEVAELVTALVDEAGREKMEWEAPTRDEGLDRAVAKQFGKALAAAPIAKGDKHERAAFKKELMAEVRDAFPASDGDDADAAKAHDKYVRKVADDIVKQGERDSILAGRRADGRDWKTIRPITIEVGVLPRVHGSVLFTRGETQSLCVATLGTVDDMQNRDGIYPEDPQHFMLHYSFPPFCVGEVRRVMGVNRREIGHGTLAERAVGRMLPPRADFPYTMRVTSEILESNGSSSMASVCGGTLALMDAGVPLKQPVAGIAMGLVMDDGECAILSDILGSEDHCGDMDFKVAGTGRGLTALQMDIKCDGLTQEILADAMEQARVGRLHILRKMLEALAQPRSEISPNAPRILTVQVPVEKIGFIIGPSGKNIRALQADYSVKISIDDSGLVNIGGFDASKAEACAAYIGDMTREIEPGELYTGRVTSIKDFGCFVEILPGQEGLCHVSELSNSFIHAVTDVVRIGDSLEVKVLDIDDFGKIKLSHKATLSDGGRDEEPVFRRGKGRSADDFDEEEVEDEVEREDETELEFEDEAGEEEFEAEAEAEAEVEVEEAEAEAEAEAEEEDEDDEEEAESARPARGSSGRDRQDADSPRPRARGRGDGRGRSDRGDRDRPDRGGHRERHDRGDRGPRGDRGSRPDGGERPDRGERSSRGDRGPRSDRGERGPSSDRGERSSGSDGGDRGERSSRGDRGERGHGSDRGDRDRSRDRDRGRDRGDRGERSPRGDRGERGHGSDRGDRGERGARGDRGEPGHGSDRGDRDRGSSRSDRGERSSGSDGGDRGERDSGERSDRPRPSREAARGRGGRDDRPSGSGRGGRGDGERPRRRPRRDD